MIKLEAIDNISIEQFAAFLDGNMEDSELQYVADAIDTSENLAGMLGGAMAAEDTLEELLSQENVVPEELLAMDFDIPEVATSADDENVVATKCNDDDLNMKSIGSDGDEVVQTRTASDADESDDSDVTSDDVPGHTDADDSICMTEVTHLEEHMDTDVVEIG